MSSRTESTKECVLWITRSPWHYYTVDINEEIANKNSKPRLISTITVL